MDRDIYVEQFGSDEELAPFCAEYHISKPRLFREYMGIIRKNTKDIFLKSLEVMAKKNLVEYMDGYEFYYKMNKRGCMGYIFTDGLNDTVHGLEEKYCNELNDAYNLSRKMAGRQLLMCVYRKPEIKGKRSIVSILTKKYLIASRQVLVCGNDPAVFLTKAIDLPENSDPCHPYDLGFLTANIQNNRMV